jgi:hypothetical protein
MNDAKTSTSPPSAPNPDRSIQKAENGKRITPGVASLLRGTQTDNQPEIPAQKPSEPKAATAPDTRPSIFRNPLVAGSLILADVVLLVLATRLVLTAQTELGFLEILLCIVAVGMGAWLACLALWRD